MSDASRKAKETADFLRTKLSISPKIAVITGTGLGSCASALKNQETIAYGEIPNYPTSTVESHDNLLVAGMMGGCPVVVMQGRFHLYEGYDPETVVFPVRVLQDMGVENLVVSNAAGGMNHTFDQGDIMIIKDHINLTGENPLVGPNEDRWGVRFPDMINAYDKSLISLADDAGKDLGITLRCGVYAGLKGPSLETPSEIRYLKTIGADAVGFSTIMEVIAAVHGGMSVLGLSTITNINDPDNPAPATVEEIIDTANQAAPKLTSIIEKIARGIK